LGVKKDPKNLLEKLAAIKCRYNIDLDKSKKKAQVIRLGACYSSVIFTTQMILREKGKELTSKTLLEEMHNQWHINWNKMENEIDSLSIKEDEEAPTAQTQKGKGGGGKSQSNPDKEKTWIHCKKKGHIETKCWKKHLEQMAEEAKTVRKKQLEIEGCKEFHCSSSS
jgi:hypothetical protein